MPAASSRRHAHGLAYLCLAALFLLSVTHWTRDAFNHIEFLLHASDHVRDPFEVGVRGDASSLQPEARAAGLTEGDVVLAVNGHPLDGLVVYYGALRGARPGDRLHAQVRSVVSGGPAVKDVTIDLRYPGDDPTIRTASAAAYIDIALGAIVMPVICIALGFWVAGVRVGDRAAWLLLVLLLSFAAFISGTGAQAFWGRDDLIQPLMVGFHVFFANIASAALMLFGIAFPERLALDRRFPWLKWLVCGPIVLVITGVAIMYGLALHALTAARDVQRALDVLEDGLPNLTLLHLTAVLLCFVSLGYKTVTASSRDARRRLLLLDAGALASVVGLLAAFVAISRGLASSGWASFLLATMVLAFPVTMAYTILVHRAMDARVVLRQGLQYLLATRGVRVLQGAISIAIIITAATISADTSIAGRVALITIGFALLAGVRGFARRLRGWIDRRFFREAYEADSILSDLASGVRTIVETATLLETVATRVAASLHVPLVAILLDGGGMFQPAYALGYASPPVAAIPDQGLIVRRLRKQQHALVQFDDDESWVQLTDEGERESLVQLQSELLLPLSLNDQLLGIMSLGPKQSEEPYSGTDIRLLDSVAAQTGLALENGRLTERIKTEVAARETHRRELEIAHEVQERLFPQDYPAVAGLEYAGACRPALGVGGDYYDFISLSKTELGIAIGDVSGKGIPAALLMATLRAFLRGQTIQHQTDLTVVMTNLNTLVYESSAPNRYATFFYAEFDAVSRALNYVNAGHNPPMVFRQADGSRDVVRLDTGGPVIGLMEDCVYHQGRVVLEPGDLLVAYTDGISEAMNAADEEWGEEQLMDAVRRNRVTASRGLIEQLMTSADAFVAGAPQHDDMTLVVVRVT